jgi:hypothetical protein
MTDKFNDFLKKITSETCKESLQDETVSKTESVAVAWMSNDGGLVTDFTKKFGMDAQQAAAYYIPLYRME